MKKSQLQELVRDVLNESPEQELGRKLALVLRRKQVAQKNNFKGKDDLNESFIISALAYLLATNTVLDMLGKYGAKIFKKYNFDKTANKLKAIHDWAHNNEKNFIKFIGGFLTPFIKDEEKRAKMAKILFIVVLAGLGIKAGVSAAQAMQGAQNAGAAISALKAALKGRDIAVVGAELASSM